MANSETMINSILCLHIQGGTLRGSVCTHKNLWSCFQPWWNCKTFRYWCTNLKSLKLLRCSTTLHQVFKDLKPVSCCPSQTISSSRKWVTSLLTTIPLRVTKPVSWRQFTLTAPASTWSYLCKSAIRTTKTCSTRQPSSPWSAVDSRSEATSHTRSVKMDTMPHRS